jgi:uncharacterized protein
MRRAWCALVVLALAAACGGLISCSKTVESAGPEALQALERGDYATVETLASSVQGLGNYRPLPSDMSLLELVAAKGKTHLVEVFIAHGADATARAYDYRNAVTIAVSCQADARLVRVLLKAGANPDAAGTDGKTPLMIAAQRGAADLVEVLLQGGANPKLRDKPESTGQGHTALEIAKGVRQANTTTLPALGSPLDLTPRLWPPVGMNLGTEVATADGLDKAIELLEAASRGGR